MKITFCGAAGVVTGSCYFISTKESKFLVDCGMFQGIKELKERNYTDFLFNPAEIDFVVLTHAHIDHSGLIPKLFKKGFKGNIHATKATKELCGVVLPDSGHIQEMEVERKNRKLTRGGKSLLEPIYTYEDALACQKYFQGHQYNECIEPTRGVSICFQDAGHILGSAIVEVCVNEDGKQTKVVFSGDLGNINQPLIEDPSNIKEADIVVMESTYGNRFHLEAENKVEALARVIRTTYKRGGNLIIPSFAVERTQDLIYDLKILKDEQKIPPMEIYIDSPMAVAATQVFINNPECFDDETQCIIKGEDARTIFEGSDIHYIHSMEESVALNNIKSGAIIISASGMADAGRIKHHLKHNLWRPECTVLFVGYQAQGTLGRRILDGEKKVTIHGEEIAVKANIEKIDGFSAHADQKGLVSWVKGFEKKPRKIFLVHGEAEALTELQRVLAEETGLKADVAVYGSTYDAGNDSVMAPREQVAPMAVSVSIGINEAFRVINQRLQNLGRTRGKDARTVKRLLSQLNDIERELGRS